MGAITKRLTDADGKSYALYAEILEKGWAAWHGPRPHQPPTLSSEFRYNLRFQTAFARAKFNMIIYKHLDKHNDDSLPVVSKCASHSGGLRQ